MRIGILGSGLMGGKLGTLFARAGHEVVFSYARSDQKLKRLAREARGNARAGTPADAARDADALLLAVHWLRIDDVLEQAGDLSEKILVTCSLPMNAKNTDLVAAHTSSGAEELAKKVRKAKVVSAFGTVPSKVFVGVFEAKRRTNRPSLGVEDRDCALTSMARNSRPRRSRKSTSVCLSGRPVRHLLEQDPNYACARAELSARGLRTMARVPHGVRMRRY